MIHLSDVMFMFESRRRHVNSYYSIIGYESFDAKIRLVPVVLLHPFVPI